MANPSVWQQYRHSLVMFLGLIFQPRATSPLTGTGKPRLWYKSSDKSFKFVDEDDVEATFAPASGNAVTTGAAQTITGEKTFEDTKLLLRNAANTFSTTVKAAAATAARVVTLPDADLTVAQAGVATASDGTGAVTGATASDGAVATSSIAPAFTGTAASKAEVEAFTGTGFATAGQVVTTSDNQAMELNECAGMWLITATQAPCLIASNTAVEGAPAVLTVFGLAPTTAAEGYKILRAPTPAGAVAGHTHTAAAHTHGAGTLAGPAHAHTQA